ASSLSALKACTAIGTTCRFSSRFVDVMIISSIKRLPLFAAAFGIGADADTAMAASAVPDASTGDNGGVTVPAGLAGLAAGSAGDSTVCSSCAASGNAADNRVTPNTDRK